MAIIKCPECDNEVFDKTITCPYCGFSIEKYYENLKMQQNNTHCSFRGNVVDFSDIVPRFKDKYSFDVFNDLCAKFEEYKIDIAYGSIMSFVIAVMTTHIIPEKYDNYDTQTDFEKFRNARLRKNTKCVIKHNDVPYDFYHVKQILKEHYHCTKEVIDYIKQIPELSEEERRQFINELNYFNLIPFTFPYDEKKVMQVDAINRITNYWGRDTESKPLPQQQPVIHKPSCPNCGSTNIKKIGFASRAVGIMAVGLLSSSIGKTFKCHNCGYKW